MHVHIKERALPPSCDTHRYCFYHETQNILGNTYGMCVLQDFEALTPNLLARTIETVEGVSDVQTYGACWLLVTYSSF